ncbi:hypothetical protein [Microbacterium elymi]|uniref:Uncharacterized protein n=1 Tax=Microbacterium elymi TaxID=2909587 RepID=A0ABY5NHW6_9MICO|nr:hypothetical protein [Microbacterium elymi]UUT34743.1 hypothetical protein L2X98_30265 [Microbacterium elymi]
MPQALADRRVVIHDEDDGMAWLCVLMPRIDAIATQRSLTSQAKHLQKNPAETRGRDQLRADLATARLRGQDTVNPVKTKVFVTIPVGILTGTAVGEGGRCTVCGGTGFPEQARIVGDELLDPLTAKQAVPGREGVHTGDHRPDPQCDRRHGTPRETRDACATRMADPPARHLRPRRLAPASLWMPTSTTSSRGPPVGARI